MVVEFYKEWYVYIVFFICTKILVALIVFTFISIEQIDKLNGEFFHEFNFWLNVVACLITVWFNCKIHLK